MTIIPNKIAYRVNRVSEFNSHLPEYNTQTPTLTQTCIVYGSIDWIKIETMTTTAIGDVTAAAFFGFPL